MVLRAGRFRPAAATARARPSAWGAYGLGRLLPVLVAAAFVVSLGAAPGRADAKTASHVTKASGTKAKATSAKSRTRHVKKTRPSRTTGAAARKVRARPAVAPAARPQYSAIVIDAESGRVLRDDNAQAPRYPASLTKMMTLYLTFEAVQRGRLTLGQKLPVSAYAQSQSPTKIGVRAGQSLTVRDAILALVTQSANDAAVVLAEGQDGSAAAFARRMTEKARALGMANTTYRNPNGLPDPGQVTTAADYAVLSRALMRDFPEQYRYFSTRSFAWGGRSFGNHNHLLEKYVGADGIKTGYINASGFNLAASATRNGRRLICVMFGGRSAAARDQQVMAMLDSGFAELGVYGGALVAKNDSSATPEPTSAPAPTLAQAAAPLVRTAAVRPADTPAPAHHSAGAALKNVLVAPAEAAEAPPARVAPATAERERPIASGGAWGIQVGAFSRKTVAERRADHAVQHAPATLSDAERIIARVHNGDGGAVYRVRFLGLTERSARQTCARLKPAKIGCVAVPPGQRMAAR